MPDLDTLFRAVTTEWEPGKVIADRAGIDRRGAGQKLTSLVKARVIESRLRQSRVASERVALYRRVDPEAASPEVCDIVTVVLAGSQSFYATAERILRDYREDMPAGLKGARIEGVPGRWFVVADAVRYQP